MAPYKISEIRMYRLQVPLKQPFSTHLQTVTERESIVVEMIDDDGHVGLGECVAFSSPWYTEETIQTCWDVLSNWLIPAVLQKEFTHPRELFAHLEGVKGNRMAKAALDLASWDLFARRKKQPLAQIIGGVREAIDAGIVLTGALDDAMHERLRETTAAGYKRVKIKIDGTTDVAALTRIVNEHPSIQFFADANGIFSKLGMAALQKFDCAGLTLIEQAFQEDEWALHRAASKKMTTPIALDESIRSVADVERMIECGAGDIIVLKPGRVGGITVSLQIHDLAKQHGIPIWIGGMIELGVSKAHNLALASLSEVKYPGDFSASNHFWKEDITKPPIYMANGQIKLRDAFGIGYELDKEIIKKYTEDFVCFP